jgi:phage-related protein
MAKEPPRKTPVVFYRTRGGAEVVRDWLRDLPEADRHAIGQDLMRVQYRWPVGMPLCRSLGEGLWEVRSALPSNRIARVLFGVHQGRIVALHGFIKKSQKTPAEDLALAPQAQTRVRGMKEAAMAKGARRPRSARKLSTLDDLLAKEDKREEFEAVAVKEVLAWQIGEAMKAGKLSRNGLAQRMKTSRSQVRRLLDPKDGNVTLTTLQRAAKIVGRSLWLELV